MQSGNAITLMIVDDDPLNRTIMRYFLKDAGYPLIECDNAASALQILDREDAGRVILFCDYYMPLMNGFECINHICANPGIYSHVTPVLITSLHPDELPEGGPDFSCCRYFPKPVDKENLLRFIEQCASAHVPA
jgi:CheY-like chemotaxis protein